MYWIGRSRVQISSPPKSFSIQINKNMFAEGRAVAVEEEEETRRERKEVEASFEASALCDGAI